MAYKVNFSFLIICLLLLTACLNPVFAGQNKDTLLLDYLWSDFSTIHKQDRPKIALVLSGGGARGLAHAGVLKVFKEAGLPVDIIVGTSVGALIGSLYAAGIDPVEIEDMALNIDWEKLVTFRLSSRSLYSTRNMEKYISRHISNKRFDELEIPFACIAVDIQTGEKIIFREGLVAPAVRASASTPGLFEPVEYRHRLLLDGGILDNLPVDVAKLMGADIIIAVALNADVSQAKINNAFQILTQVIVIQSDYISKLQSKKADVLIVPDVRNIRASDLDKAKELVEAGEIATRKSVHNIRKVILNNLFSRILDKR